MWPAALLPGGDNTRLGRDNSSGESKLKPRDSAECARCGNEPPSERERWNWSPVTGCCCLTRCSLPAWPTDEGTQADFQCWAGALGQEQTRGLLVSWEDNLFNGYVTRAQNSSLATCQWGREPSAHCSSPGLLSAMHPQSGKKDLGEETFGRFTFKTAGSLSEETLTMPWYMNFTTVWRSSNATSLRMTIGCWGGESEFFGIVWLIHLAGVGSKESLEVVWASREHHLCQKFWQNISVFLIFADQSNRICQRKRNTFVFSFQIPKVSYLQQPAENDKSFNPVMLNKLLWFKQQTIKETDKHG